MDHSFCVFVGRWGRQPILRLIKGDPETPFAVLLMPECCVEPIYVDPVADLYLGHCQKPSFRNNEFLTRFMGYHEEAATRWARLKTLRLAKEQSSFTWTLDLLSRLQKRCLSLKIVLPEIMLFLERDGETKSVESKELIDSLRARRKLLPFAQSVEVYRSASLAPKPQSAST